MSDDKTIISVEQCYELPSQIIERAYAEKKESRREVKLKECPFCGGKAVTREFFSGEVLSIHCSVCGIRDGLSKVKSEAIKCWNRRVKE